VVDHGHLLIFGADDDFWAEIKSLHTGRRENRKSRTGGGEKAHDGFFHRRLLNNNFVRDATLGIAPALLLIISGHRKCALKYVSDIFAF
jgi:hypothetical protein